MKTEWAIYHRRRAKIYADIVDDHAEQARGIQSELTGTDLRERLFLGS